MRISGYNYNLDISNLSIWREWIEKVCLPIGCSDTGVPVGFDNGLHSSLQYRQSVNNHRQSFEYSTNRYDFEPTSYPDYNRTDIDHLEPADKHCSCHIDQYAHYN